MAAKANVGAEIIDPLNTKYRPQTFEEVVGHDAVVKSLKHTLERGTSRNFLFTGPSGVGKTTFGYLIANYFKCDFINLHEIDGATHTGIDDMRAVMEDLRFRPLGTSAVKVVLLDEVQGLSKQAVDALLKTTEKPPPWVVWIFCSTEPAKIRKTLYTRCTSYELKPVNHAVLISFLTSIAGDEKLPICGTKDYQDIIALCVENAEGSPRQALSNLAKIGGVKSFDEAARLMRTHLQSQDAIDLARLLVGGTDWKGARAILVRMKDADPESVRMTIRAYMTTVVLKENDDKSLKRALAVLEAFSKPFYAPDGLSPIVLACGSFLVADPF